MTGFNYFSFSLRSITLALAFKRRSFARLCYNIRNPFFCLMLTDGLPFKKESILSGRSPPSCFGFTICLPPAASTCCESANSLEFRWCRGLAGSYLMRPAIYESRVGL